MKKKLSFLLFAVITGIMASILVSAAEPALVMEFNNTPASEINKSFSGYHGCEYTFDSTSMSIVSLNGPDEGGTGDPYMYFTSDVSADKAQWIKMRIKNLSEAENFEFHFASDATDSKITGATCTHFPISAKDEDFKEYVFNVGEYNEKKHSASVWNGTISQIRFDFMWMSEPSGQVPTGSQMIIDYVAFFETEDDANAYVHTEKTEPESVVTEKVDYSDCVTFVFNNDTTISRWRAGGSNAFNEFGFCRYVPTSGDPTFGYFFDNNDAFDTADVRYLGIRYKATSTVNYGVYFVSTDKHTSFADQGHRSFPLLQGSWTSSVIDLKENAFWEGKITGFRLDIINGLDLNADILIDRIGFFKTKKQADYFLSEGREAPDYSLKTVVSKNLQKIIVPPNSFSAENDISEFSLSSTTPEGTGTTSPVVKYTSPDGKSNIVALSYVNNAGYTTMVASKPGKYSLTYNHKEYVDIAGHWGEDYINFVSDRTLFGGTSPTEFSPEETMTRGMFITVLGRMHGIDTSLYDGNTAYTDVPSSEYYAPYIQWSDTTGIMAPVAETKFAPEEPITRETMAKVINNYVKAYSYDIPTSEVKDFEDLSDTDPQSIAAIRFVQSLGIINGNTPTTFNPKGISTRAEVATVMKRVILSVLELPLTYNTEIQKEKILIGGWSNFKSGINEETIKTFAEAGMNLIVGTGEFDNNTALETIMKLSDKYGLLVLPHNYVAKYYENSEEVPTVMAKFYDYPSYFGNHIVDEPGSDDFPELGKIAKQYTEKYPGKVPFYNLLPMYANAAQLKFGAGAAAIDYYDSDPDLYRKHVEAYAQNIDTHYICVDIYPLKSGNTLYNDYCKNMDVFASVCREYGRDFWLYIQTVGLSLDHVPNERDLRWQCYTGLSFGVKTFIHFTYGSYNETSYPNWTYSMVKNDGTPTPTYYAAQKVNNELTAISDVYVQYKNLGAFNVNCTPSTPYLSFDNQYDFDLISSIDSNRPLLVGCFEKKEGEGKAFTVVNMANVYSIASADVTFKLSEAKTVTAYIFGEPTVLTPDFDGTYTLSLENGQGVFITVD